MDVDSRKLLLCSTAWSVRFTYIYIHHWPCCSQLQILFSNGFWHSHSQIETSSIYHKSKKQKYNIHYRYSALTHTCECECEFSCNRQLKLNSFLFASSNGQVDMSHDMSKSHVHWANLMHNSRCALSSSSSSSTTTMPSKSKPTLTHLKN